MESDLIWQQRLDKEHRIIAAYKALYEAQAQELNKLTVGSLEYCRLVIQQLQLADEIEAKEMYAQRIVQDKEQQAKMVEHKAKFADERGDEVLKALRGKLSSQLVKGNERAHYQALLKQANETEGNEYNNNIFNIATALGLI